MILTRGVNRVFKKLSLLVLAVLVPVLMFATGCDGEPPAAQNDRPVPEQELPDMAKLEEKGISLHSMWEEAGVLYFSGSGMDQRALEIITAAVEDETPIIVFEQPEVLLVRGTIIEISPTDNNGSLGTLYVEGEDRVDTETDAAYVYISQVTRILKPEENGLRALPFSELEEGMEVEVKITGVVLESYPPRAGASTVTIKQD